jgi:hypothetical protein
MWFRKKKRVPSTAADLRELALSFTPADFGVASAPDRSRVFGALMESTHPEGTATLACFADGATSLYFSGGGGLIGAGEHATVRVAATAFLTSVEAHVFQFAAAAAESPRPFPPVGSTQFFVHTYSGLLTTVVDDAQLGTDHHPLSTVFAAGQGVITAIRELGLA